MRFVGAPRVFFLVCSRRYNYTSQGRKKQHLCTYLPGVMVSCSLILCKLVMVNRQQEIVSEKPRSNWPFQNTSRPHSVCSSHPCGPQCLRHCGCLYVHEIGDPTPPGDPLGATIPIQWGGYDGGSAVAGQNTPFICVS